jgi:hypothetical protein
MVVAGNTLEPSLDKDTYGGRTAIARFAALSKDDNSSKVSRYATVNAAISPLSSPTILFASAAAPAAIDFCFICQNMLHVRSHRTLMRITLFRMDEQLFSR